METKVVGAEVGRNVTRLACEPSLAVAHVVLQFVFASVAMTRVWVAVVCVNYKRQTYGCHVTPKKECTSLK